MVVYIAVANGPDTSTLCERFVGSWLAHGPGSDYQLVVACNGGPLTHDQGALFTPLDALFFPRPNDPGFDLTAYQDCAMKFECDLLVCCGQSIHFHRAGWLKRYEEAFNQFGPGMYGTFSSNLVRPHLNTTGFAISPKFLLSSPRPQNKKARYDFEHGEHSIWKRVNQLGFPTKLVTWDGCYDPLHWRVPPNILWRGDQSNCLMFCSHTDRWAAQDYETKKRWSRNADVGGKWV